MHSYIGHIPEKGGYTPSNISCDLKEKFNPDNLVLQIDIDKLWFPEPFFQLPNPNFVWLSYSKHISHKLM